MTSIEAPSRLDRDQVRAIGEMLGRSFHDDPPSIWFLPDEARRRRALRDKFTADVRYGDRYGQIYVTVDAIEGAAIWLPPDDPFPSTLRMLRVDAYEVISMPLRYGTAFVSRYLTLMNRLEELHKTDMTDRHWYLMTLGVEPERQGKGVGGALIQPGLANADRDGLVCYLETSKEINLRFYGNHGFEVLREIRMPGGGPTLWTMQREPAA
ncbi:MAG: GNAT family N-acetyltransferase [Chloroflexi bacterium]|nr:GNAT family N-acetyltransferase [Chloroflexota bacterium]